MTTITLTSDQQTAMEAFTTFLADPIESVFVLSGYSGTGKTTLVKTLLDRLPSLIKTVKLLCPTFKHYDIELTATTNKAAEAFGQITGYPVKTIHSYLGLRVHTDYATDTTTLVPTKKEQKERTLLFIDEASYIDKQLLGLIFKMTRDCKIVFMGDPAQLTPVKSQGTPVFDANFTGASLTKVVRQAEGNPIIDLSTKFRDTVNSGEFFQFVPDGHHIQYLDRDSFNQQITEEFTRPGWKYQDSKILAWTNKRVIEYNHLVSSRVSGDPSFQVGDYAIVNKYVTCGRRTLKTDQLVCITGIETNVIQHVVMGKNMTLDYCMTLFFPDSLKEKNAFIKWARADDQLHLVAQAEQEWVDLRQAFACTVNKSQGSTYDKVFIDIDDISRCNMGEQIARLLYVAVSRARSNVYLTGDFV